MPILKRRSPIIREGQVGPSAGSVLGQGLQGIGQGLSKIAKERKDSDEKSQAIEDYLSLKKSHKEFAIQDLNQSSQMEDYNGHSGRVDGFISSSVDEAIASSGKKKRSTYAKTMVNLGLKDRESMVSKAIDDEEMGRFKVNANRFSRTISSTIEESDDGELYNILSSDDIPEVFSESMSANNIMDTPERREDIKKSAFNEMKGRVLNVDIESEDIYRSILESDKFKEMAGNDYNKIRRTFEDKLRYDKNLLLDSEMQLSKEFNTGFYNSFSESLRNVQIGGVATPEIINRIAGDHIEMIDEAVANGSITPFVADKLRAHVSTQSERATKDIIAPRKEAAESSLNSYKAEVKHLIDLKSSVGDDKDTKEIRNNEVANRELILYGNISETLRTSEGLGLSSEDTDWLEQNLAELGNNIDTRVSRQQNTPFWSPNTEEGDPDRLGVQMNKILWQLGNGLAGEISGEERAVLDRAMKRRYISWLSERQGSRNRGEKVPDFDVIEGGQKEAERVAMDIFNQAMLDILPEEQRNQVVEATKNRKIFMDGAETLFNSEGTREAFIAHAEVSGFSKDEAGALYDALDAEDKASTLNPELKYQEVTIGPDDDPYEKARELEAQGTPESIELANQIRGRFGYTLEERGAAMYKEIYDFAHLYGYGDKIWNSISGKVSEVLGSIKENVDRLENDRGASSEFLVDPSGAMGYTGGRDGAPVTFNTQKQSGEIPPTPQEFPTPEEQKEIGMATGTDSDPLQGTETTIDISFIKEEESPGGKPILIGYVPEVKNDEGVVTSGVTIASGFDLGQHNESDLRRLGFDKNMIAKFKPYLGLKGDKAEKVAESLTVTDTEAEKIDSLVLKHSAAVAKKEYEKSGKKFSELSKAQRTVLTSVAHQFGSYKKTPSFIKYAKAGEWEKVIEELRHWHGKGSKKVDKFKNRRYREAKLLEDDIKGMKV